MHDACAVVGCRVVGQEDGAQTLVTNVYVIKRMHEVEQCQVFTWGGGDDLPGELIALQALFNQRFRQHQNAALGVDQRVGQLGVQVKGLIGGDGPGSGGPDNGKRIFVQVFQTKSRCQLVGLKGFKTHIQRLRFFVCVFNFKLGQRRAAVKTPIHRLQAPVHKAAFHDAFQCANFVGLIRIVHRAVRVVPLTQHAQAFEVFTLPCDLLCCKSPAF